MIELKNGSYTMTSLPVFVSIGKYSSIGSNVIFHSLEQEHHCSINRQCVYTTNWEQPRETGSIIIGNDVWIGDGVRILPNTIIEDGVIIGAGSVVKGRFPAFSVIVGNPGKVIRKRFSPEQQRKIQNMAWWNWGREVIENRKEDMKNIENFLNKYYE